MRTVFVIGAGANVEIGMPSGNELKTKIAEILESGINRRFPGERSDELIGSVIDYYALSDNENSDNYYDKLDALQKAAHIIIKAMPLAISIDNFIEAHRGNSAIEFCGKLAIVRTILNAEHYCHLYKVYVKCQPEDIIAEKEERLYSSWYPLLFQKITEGCHVDELAERFDNISFIIFNYDRCFEYFMYSSLIISYGVDHKKAMEFIQRLHINHPYGTVGNLWDEKGNLTFGKQPTEIKLIQLAKNIITFTGNRAHEKTMRNNAKYLAARADRIIFLGFAYHKQNIDLLFNYHGVQRGAIPISDKTTCYGTGYKKSEGDNAQVRKFLMEANKHIIECFISDITCAQFFNDFSYRLSFK